MFSDHLAESQAVTRRATGSASAAPATTAGAKGWLLMAGTLSRIVLDNRDYRGFTGIRYGRTPAGIRSSLARFVPLLYGDGRTARTFADDSANAQVPGDRYEMGLNILRLRVSGP